VARRAAGEAPGAIPSRKSAGARVLACTEQNVNAAFELANVLVRAKDPGEAFVPWGEYLKAQPAPLHAQVKELGAAIHAQFQLRADRPSSHPQM